MKLCTWYYEHVYTELIGSPRFNLFSGEISRSVIFSGTDSLKEFFGGSVFFIVSCYKDGLERNWRRIKCLIEYVSIASTQVNSEPYRGTCIDYFNFAFYTYNVTV